ncbi:hypothetical protein ACH4TS_19775 [Streptomyces albidoflavus]
MKHHKIAKKLGINISTVNYQVRAYGHLSIEELKALRDSAAERDKMLREEWSAGTPTDAIAKKIGVGSKEVTSRRIALGLPSRHCRPKLTSAERVEIDRILSEEWEAGTPVRAIAERTGLKVWEVNKRRDALGLPLRQVQPQRKSKETRAEEEATLRREWNAGTTRGKIGEMLGIKEASVRKRARNLGLAARTGGRPPGTLSMRSKPRAITKEQAERDAILRTEWMAGTEGKAIAEKIGITTCSVYKRRRKLGLPSRVGQGETSPAKNPFEAKRRELEAALREAWTAGTPAQAVAGELGMHQTSVHRHWRNMGLYVPKPRRKRLSPAEKRAILDLVEVNMPPDKIAERLKLELDVVSRTRRKALRAAAGAATES